MSGPLDVEAAYVGAVLHLDAPSARDTAELVSPDDLADPRLAVVLRGALQLAGFGVAPDPVAVLQLLRADGAVTGPQATQGLAELLHETYAGCPLAASVRWYAAGVLDEALRRRAVELADRIRQASNGPLDTLVQLVAAETTVVQQLQERRSAVTREALPT